MGEWFSDTWFMWYIRNVTIWGPFLVMLAGLVSFARMNRLQKSVWGFATFSFFMEFCSTSPKLKHLFSGDVSTNSPWYHIGVPFLFILLSNIYAPYLDKSIGRKRYLLMGAFFVIVLVNAFWGDGYLNFPNVTSGLYAVTSILTILGYFLYLLRTMKVKRLDRAPLVWLSAGFLIYYSINFLLWLTLTLIAFDQAFFISIYRIHGVATIFLYSIIMITLFYQEPLVKTTELKT